MKQGDVYIVDGSTDRVGSEFRDKVRQPVLIISPVDTNGWWSCLPISETELRQEQSFKLYGGEIQGFVQCWCPNPYHIVRNHGVFVETISPDLMQAIMLKFLSDFGI